MQALKNIINRELLISFHFICNIILISFHFTFPFKYYIATKSLKTNAENAEQRCDDLSKQIEELQQKYDAERRKNERILQEKTKKNDLQKVELKSINYAGGNGERFNEKNSDSICVSFRN